MALLSRSSPPNRRVEATKTLGIEKIPCLFVEHLSDAQKRAYVIADNKIALNAGWDEDLLAEELSELSLLDESFDLSVTGFSFAELDHLIEAPNPSEAEDPEDNTLPQSYPARVQEGDIWQLGRHRLICGNSLDSNTVQLLMDGAPARMVFTDPPYNVKIDGHVGGNGQVKHREFAMVSGEMSPGQFIAFLQTSFKNLVDHSLDGSIHFICMDWRHMGEVLKASEDIYSELKNLIIWAKDQGGMGTFYRSRHELIFAFKNGTEPHVNTFELGQFGRYRTNVWEYRSANLEELRIHPTVKPVAMIADAMRDVSGRGDIVLDLFGGSGSTLIAAEKTGRNARLCELSPHYCDLILSRWEAYTHDEAQLLSRDGHSALEAAE